MSKYFVCIERLEVVEVNANSEEHAVSIVKQQLDTQDPRNTAKISIAKEICLDWYEKNYSKTTKN